MKAKFIKQIISLAGPMVLIRLFYILINVIGMVLISHLGKLEFAAGALITALLNTIMVIAMSSIIAVSIIASRYFGSHDYEKIGQTLRASFLISTLISIIVILVLWHISYFLTMFKQPGLLIPYVSSYFKAIAWSILPSLLIANLHQFCFSIKKQSLVFIWSIVLLALTVFLGVCLIHGYLGFPNIGMDGWAYAISISNWMLLIYALIYLAFRKEFSKFKFFVNHHLFSLEQFKLLYTIGFPIILQISGELIIFLILNLMIGWISLEALSVQQIILQTMLLTLMIPMGTGQACAILIGQSIGNKQIQNIKPICAAGMTLVGIIMLSISAIYILFPTWIIGLFTNLNKLHPSFISLASTVLFIAALSQSADALRNVQIGFLRGLRDMWVPLALNLVILISALPMAYYLGFTCKFGLIGISGGFAGAFFIAALMMHFRLNQKLKAFNTKATESYLKSTC